MEGTPEAAPQGTEAAPQTAATEPIKNEAPEINAEQVAKYFGTDTETLGKFQKFVDANGKFDSAFSKMKTNISNPDKTAEKPVENSQTPPQRTEEPTSHTQAQPGEQQTQQPLPKGARTNEDLMAEYYFRTLSEKPEYSAISEDIRRGNVITEMDKLGINYRYPNGAWNDERINEYLKLKAQTVPAKPTNAEPNASAAPTVSYTEVGEGGFTDINQAYKVLMEPGNPNMAKAEEFIKNHFNPDASKK